MARKCLRCKSSEVDELSAELTFARENALPICSLQGTLAVCFACGFAECFVPQELLAELKRGANYRAQPTGDKPTQ